MKCKKKKNCLLCLVCVLYICKLALPPWLKFLMLLFISLTGIASSQIASNCFTLGTAAVLPFYTLMVVAPKAELVNF